MDSRWATLGLANRHRDGAAKNSVAIPGFHPSANLAGFGQSLHIEQVNRTKATAPLLQTLYRACLTRAGTQNATCHQK